MSARSVSSLWSVNPTRFCGAGSQCARWQMHPPSLLQRRTRLGAHSSKERVSGTEKPESSQPTRPPPHRTSSAAPGLTDGSLNPFVRLNATEQQLYLSFCSSLFLLRARLPPDV
ncbi:unnamed protein product [Pleuronectes platessa]|uniref:Uncharacterized protein n=1 Tax=Pleuronectes platessa TaxID=8262 RepID=A0A9N7YY09_PLEPL|nr:unnamed protein product [Pleuronectes platessa]